MGSRVFECHNLHNSIPANNEEARKQLARMVVGEPRHGGPSQAINSTSEPLAVFCQVVNVKINLLRAWEFFRGPFCRIFFAFSKRYVKLEQRGFRLYCLSDRYGVLVN